MNVLRLATRLSGRLISASLGLAAIATTIMLGVPPPLRAQSPMAGPPQSEPMRAPDWQSAAGGKMSFEVASVRQSKPEDFKPPNFPLDPSDNYSGSHLPRGRFYAVFPLSSYIGFAYKQWLTPKSRESLVANLPKWVATDFFEINARAEGSPTKDQMRLMMQSLLADRFNLKVHFETQQVPVYALILEKSGKTGPKLRPHADGPPCTPPPPQDSHGPLANAADIFPARCDSFALVDGPNGTMLFGSRNSTMGQIAASIADTDLDRPVVDQTGLEGRFDFAIEWKPDSEDSSSPGAIVSLESMGVTFLSALGEQLGLKLIPTKAPVRVLIVDHVDRPSEN
jgi:bla regulator protein BlaR1